MTGDDRDTEPLTGTSHHAPAHAAHAHRPAEQASATGRHHVPAHARRRRWRTPLAVLLATIAASGAAVGSAFAGARWSDAREQVLPPPVTSSAQELPILVPADGAAPSAIGGTYALESYDDATRASVLSAWGAAPSAANLPTLADDAIATDGAVPHATPCQGCDGAEGIVLAGGHDPPANTVSLLPFPRPEDGLADECRFSDVGADELPIAVVTGNPGEIELRVGADRYGVSSEDDERDEWEAWLDGPAGPRPPGSFVVHCIAVEAPTGDETVIVRALARDDTGTAVTAVAALVPQGGDQAPVVITPLDGTLLGVDVPLATTSSTATVTTGAVDDGCDGPDAGTQGWRPGSEAVLTAPALPGERPYLAGAPAALRRLVALPEGESTLVCVEAAGRTTAVVVTPPDTRRLTLSVTDTTDAVDVDGTFASIGWAACRGAARPSIDTVLCESAGDTGAIAAAGGLLDVTVRAGDRETTARIPLSAAPGGAARDVYRLELPGAGSVELTAAWSAGASGAGDAWLFDAPE